MKTKYLYAVILVAGMLLTSCFPEQDVEPVDPPGDNPMVTITPGGDYSSIREGDVLTFDITVDKMIQSPLTFEVVMADGSTADDHDFTTAGATLAAFSKSTTLTVIVAADQEIEGQETLAFSIIPDFHWDWQINPESDKEPVTATVKDLSFTLDWSAGTYEGTDLCEWDVDLDLFAENADGSAYNYDGASAACPVEIGNIGGLPDDTYDIYVQYWNGGIPALAGVSIPYVVSFNDNKGGFYTIEGAFNSDDAKRTMHRVGAVVVAGGTYTLLDADGTQLGTL